MAHDDYYVLVCKILVYLYRRLKQKTKVLPQNYILPLTKDFPVHEDYLLYVLEQMSNQGLIERVHFTRAWGGDIVGVDVDKVRITPAGIDYLLENSMMKKLVEKIPDAAAIFSLFQNTIV